MDVEIGKTGAKLVLTSGMLSYFTNMMGIGAYYSINNVTITEGRNYVEHTMPGRTGSLFQDMGRPAIKIVLEGNMSEDGIIHGWRKGGGKFYLEELHKLCDTGMPVDFLCDMPTLFGVSKVVIQELEASEVKGRKHNYNYKLTLKEWSEDASSVDMVKFAASMATDATKQFAKKAIIVAAVAGAAGTYIGVTSIKKEETLAVAVKGAKSVIMAGDSVEVTVTVSDSKGNPIVDADVTLTQVVDGKSLFSGKSDADGKAVATFEGPADGSGFKNYELKATATKTEFKNGEGSGFITVDSRLRAKITADNSTIKTSGSPDKATVTVKVTDYNNKAVEGVTVSITCTSTKITITHANKTTNGDGITTATASSTVAGTYDIKATATKSPYVDGTATISIKVT
jgi:hypothetical protein